MNKTTMEQRDKIDALKLEIQQKHSEIEQLMIETIKKYGGEIEATNGRKYKAIENSGVNFLIEGFIVEEDKLSIRGDFDGDSYEINTESLYITELSEAMFMIIDDKSRLVQEKIKKLNDEFIAKNDTPAQFAECQIMYLDGGDMCDVTIKLSTDLDEDDDAIFFYCDSQNELKHFTREGGNDFIVVDIYELTY